MRIQEDGTSTDIEMFSEFATSGRVVVFDTETTGGSCSDEICQLAAAEYINGRLERTMNVYIFASGELVESATVSKMEIVPNVTFTESEC